MAVFGKELGQLTGDTEADMKKIVNYIAYMLEQVEFNDANVKRRLAALEEGN